MDIDNHDMCNFGIIASLKARKGPHEKVIVNNGIPMLVRKTWLERLLTSRSKEETEECPRLS